MLTWLLRTTFTSELAILALATTAHNTCWQQIAHIFVHNSYLLLRKVNLRLHFLQEFHAQNQWHMAIQQLKTANEVVLTENNSQLNNTNG